MIDTRRIALLHVAKKALGLAEDTYRDLLRAEAGVDSAKLLDDAGFDRVMRRLERDGFVSTAKKRRRDRRRQHHPDALITRDQQTLIATLYHQLGMTTPERQMGFAKRTCGKSFPQSRADANKVIEGLKAMLKRASSAAETTLEGGSR